MADGVQQESLDILINVVNQLLADLELSAIASAGFYKETRVSDPGLH
jgi:hypothetical protein